MRSTRRRTLKLVAVLVVVLLVVGEGHHLRDIHEPAIHRVLEAAEHAVPLRLDAVLVVLALDLHEAQRHSVYEEGDVWSEAVFAVLAG